MVKRAGTLKELSLQERGELSLPKLACRCSSNDGIESIGIVFISGCHSSCTSKKIVDQCNAFHELLIFQKGFI